MQFDISKANIGKTDRLIRTIVGALLIIGAFNGGGWLAAVIGAVLIGTAYLRFCPAYNVFGLSTVQDEAPAASRPSDRPALGSRGGRLSAADAASGGRWPRRRPA